MGVRTFDAASKHFLSLDPLESVPGTGWFADSYSFVGNNPVGLMDPWGTRPVSIEEYDKYAEHANTRFWVKTAFNLVAIVATVAAVAVTGPVAIIALSAVAGAASAAASAMDKVGPDGGIDWGSVGKDALVGGLVGGATAGATKIFTLGRGGFLAHKGSKAKAVMDKVEAKVLDKGSRQAQRAEKTLEKLKAKDPKLLDDDYLKAHTTFLGREGGEVAGDFTAGAIEGAYDYSKKAGDDWSMRGMLLSATTGGVMKGGGAAFKTFPKGKLDNADFKKLPGIRNMADGSRAQRWTASTLKNTASEGLNASVDIPRSALSAPMQNGFLRLDRDDYMAQHPGENPKGMNRAQVKDKSYADIMAETAWDGIAKQGDPVNVVKNGVKVGKGAKPPADDKNTTTSDQNAEVPTPEPVDE